MPLTLTPATPTSLTTTVASVGSLTSPAASEAALSAMAAAVGLYPDGPSAYPDHTNAYPSVLGLGTALAVASATSLTLTPA